jgi:anti-sigma regulatory factor (Ser/Thr protein kinase)
VPLGTTDPVNFLEQADHVDPGGVLMLYTDGLVELRDVSLDDRLAQLVTVASVADGELGDVCDQILNGVLGGRRPADDVALLAVRLQHTPADALALRLPADPRALPPMRRRLERFLRGAGASDRDRFEIAIAVGEAAMNAIEHAYGPVDAEFAVEVSVEQGVAVDVTVRDDGRWRERRGRGGRGRGLAIMRDLMDEVELDAGSRGTAVRMRRALEPSTTPERT